MIHLLASILLAHAQQPLTAGRIFNLPKAGGFDYMTVDAKYRRVFATHGGAGTLAVLNLKTGAFDEIDTGKVNGVQIDEALGRVFTAGAGQKLVALDRKSLKRVGEVSFDGPGDDIVVDTKRQQIYVCHDDGDKNWVFDARTLKPLGTVQLAGIPEYSEYDASRDRLYQNIKDKNLLQVLDPARKVALKSWPTAPMESPHGLALDTKTGRAFAAGRNGKLSVFDLNSGRLLTTVDIAPGTDQIAFDADLRRVYCTGKGAISVVQETSSGVRSLGSVSAPAGAHTIAIDLATHDVWVCFSNPAGAHFQVFKAAK